MIFIILEATSNVHFLLPVATTFLGANFVSRLRASHPCTLHPTPYTMHPTSYTLHPTSYTLHPTPYTMHPTQCT